MSPLIECVPNFSEGRDAAKIEAIARVMEQTGAYVLDRQMDADHHRSVITAAGPPEVIAEAAIRAVGKAAELIDLDHHQGVHPRIGATDVVPFVPLDGITMQDCVKLARHVGEQIWSRYRIPVYLYEAAAASLERSNLAAIRRGQFEGMRDGTGGHASLMPDFGDCRVHPTAGATAVGARKFLIAYNIFLATEDINVAKQVARGVRYSSGGLPHVKASGFQVNGTAQVSMNLTDFEQTPIYQVFARVEQEAARRHTNIQSSELIGLIPQKALDGAPAWFLKTMNFAPQILETRMAQAIHRSHS